MIRVAPLLAKLYENKLRWFRHVKRKTVDAPMRMLEKRTIEGKRSQGRLKRTCEEQLKIDLCELHLSKDLMKDTSNWRRCIHILDF